MRLATVSALATFGLDQLSKLAVLHGLGLINRGEVDILPPFLVFRMAWNRGVNFGLLSGESEIARWGLIVIALVISAWVWVWVRRDGATTLTQISAGLLVGGALGNVIDRIAYGAVADFLNMSCCGIENPYAFNVADVSIFVGALGLVLFSGRPPRDKSPRVRKPTRKTP